MSSRSFTLLVSIAILVSGAIFFLPSDEKKITDTLHLLAEKCSTTTQESVIESLRKANTASKLFTSLCKVEVQSRNINREFSQKEIADNIIILKKRLPNTIFHFQDMNIEIVDKTNANVITTLLLNGTSSEEQFTDAYEVDITVDKVDGTWLFSSFTIVEFMVK